MTTAEQKPVISIHPAAAIFPMMSDEEIAELAESIKKHGLREKIHAIISSSEEKTDWQVVDGRNRLEAIRRHLEMSDTDIIAAYMTPVSLAALHATVEEYVMMANIERRNLTQAQRRDLAGKLAIMLEEQQKNLPKSEQVDTLQVAAEKAGVSRRTAATSKTKARAKKPTTVRDGQTEPAPPTEKPYVPLRPSAVGFQLEAIGKAVSHVAQNEVEGKIVPTPELDKWTLDELRDAEQKCRFTLDVLEAYIPQRQAREEKVLREKLAALEGGDAA